MPRVAEFRNEPPLSLLTPSCVCLPAAVFILPSAGPSTGSDCCSFFSQTSEADRSGRWPISLLRTSLMDVCCLHASDLDPCGNGSTAARLFGRARLSYSPRSMPG